MTVLGISTSVFRTWLGAACLVWLLFALGCEGRLDGESKPAVSNLAVNHEPVRGVAVVGFRLWDAKGYPTDVQLEYTTEGKTWRNCTLSGGASFEDLRSGEEGPQHELAWDSATDIPGADATVSLRLTADNGFHQAVGRSETFLVRNGDAPPTLSLATLPSEVGGMVPLSVMLSDDKDNTLSVYAEVAIGDRDFSPATLTDAEGLSATPEGTLHTLSWNSSADVGYDLLQNVRLRLWAEDSTGAGEAVESAVFRVRHNPELSILLDEPVSRVRFELPLSFSLVGPTEERATGLLEFSQDDGVSWQRATLIPYWQSPLEWLRVHPAGADHLVRWDTFADLSELVERKVRLRLSIGLMSWPQDQAPLVVDTQSFDVINSPQKVDVLLSEVFRGEGTGKGFIELIGQPGHSLDNYRLREVWGDGFPDPPQEPWVIYLDGYEIPQDRAFVIAGPDGVAADFLYEHFDQFFLKGLPTNFLLEHNYYSGNTDEAGDAEEESRVWRVVDALGLGDFAGWSFLGESRAAPDPGTDQSITREFSNCDSEDNSQDFVVTDPSPGIVQPFEE